MACIKMALSVTIDVFDEAVFPSDNEAIPHSRIMKAVEYTSYISSNYTSTNLLSYASWGAGFKVSMRF